jgi:hypothetical protein
MMDGRPTTAERGSPFKHPELDSREPSADRPRPDPFAARLRFSPLWGPNPAVPHQAKRYPDTVDVVAIRYVVLDAACKEDMDVYSALKISDAVFGRFVIEEEKKLCHKKSGSVRICVQFSERRFKQL